MGAPVSKPGNIKSDNIAETLFESSTHGSDTEVETDVHNNDGSSSPALKSSVKEYEVVQFQDDDNFDDEEWGDIYKRLKTNRNDDLHILNTRFNRNDLRALPDGNLKTSEPIFTSTFAERPTRINSANFSPHAVAYEREKSRVTTDLRLSTDVTEKESLDEEERDESDSILNAEKEALSDIGTVLPNYDPNIQNTSQNCETLTSTQDTCNEFENDKREIVKQLFEKTETNDFMYQGKACLNIPSDNTGTQSSNLMCHGHDSLSLDDNDIDPLAGLDIPRERTHSFGSLSIYSVKEISDDLYQQYKAEIKNCIRSYGFFEAFPSPSIVREAQKIYRRLDMPSPVDEDGNILPHPPKITKNEYLSEESNLFEEARERIENMPESLSLDGKTVDIVHYLCRGLDDDKAKLTMLSAWIVFQQMRGEKSMKIGADKPEDWCRHFRTMCRFARIKTKLVKGIIRGPNYVPGSNVNLNHGHWLAVLVNYTWLLIDPFRYHSNTTHPLIENFDKDLYHYVEKMFQDPEDFIYSHYPDEEHWQLLARPVTKAELDQLAVLHSGFFSFEMTLINYPKSVMVIKTPESMISLAFHEDKMLQFKCKLRDCDDTLSLARARTYVFLETNLKDHLVNARVRFPKKGSYILEILGSPDECSWQSVVSYKLVYEGEVHLNPFPFNPREEWGPGLETAKMGLTPVLHHSGEILMQKGIVQILFHDKERLQFDHVLFKGDNNISSDSLKVSFLKDKNNDVIFVIDIDTKITGVFMLQLLARADARTDFKNFCNYLIRKEKTVLIPTLKFNNRSISTEETEHIVAPKSGKLHFTVDATGFIQLTVELKLQDRQELNFSEHARHWIEDSTGHIDLNFPRKGRYTLQVLGRSVNKGRFQNIKEGIIHVEIPSEKWSPFPKEGNNWNSWYKIEAPLSHHLEEKEDITFKVNVKNALDVAVLSATGWYHLDRVDAGWQYIGQVWTGPKSTRCRLLARFETGSDKWSDLLWFKIMSEEDFEGMEERQNIAREKALLQCNATTNLASKTTLDCE